ncbi:WhiB family transcriptional regulator [Geodermatophilus sp. SYSU D01186]
MAESGAGINAAYAIPKRALDEWLRLAAELEEAGTVPCRTSDPEAWWPDPKQMDDDMTQEAIADCYRCPVREACAAYAIAARENDGIWGGLLPAERQQSRRAAA